MTYYHRKSPRIPHYDYSLPNYYFITICTNGKKCFFGSPGRLNEFGAIARNHLLQIESHYDCVKVDKYVIMPNHVHLILVIQPGSALGAEQIIGQYKSGVSREIRKQNPDIELWQRSFHDHIIRNQRQYEKIWMYIETNPLKWNTDCFYVKQIKGGSRPSPTEELGDD